MSVTVYYHSVLLHDFDALAMRSLRATWQVAEQNLQHLVDSKGLTLIEWKRQSDFTILALNVRDVMQHGDIFRNVLYR